MYRVAVDGSTEREKLMRRIDHSLAPSRGPKRKRNASEVAQIASNGPHIVANHQTLSYGFHSRPTGMSGANPEPNP